MKDNHPDLQFWIEPELEVRIVAWVLGEASEFEAAELERIAGERPEVMAFKREIEAVHGLIGSATRAESKPLRLSSERRAKLMEKFGVSPEGVPGKVEVLPRKSERPWWSLRMSLVGYAATAAILVVLAGISVPCYTSVNLKARKRAQASQTLADLRMLDASIDQYAIEHNAATETASAVNRSDIQAYLKAGTPLYSGAGDDRSDNSDGASDTRKFAEANIAIPSARRAEPVSQAIPQIPASPAAAQPGLVAKAESKALAKFSDADINADVFGVEAPSKKATSGESQELSKELSLSGKKIAAASANAIDALNFESDQAKSDKDGAEFPSRKPRSSFNKMAPFGTDSDSSIGFSIPQVHQSSSAFMGATSVSGGGVTAPSTPPKENIPVLGHLGRSSDEFSPSEASRIDASDAGNVSQESVFQRRILDPSAATAADSDASTTGNGVKGQQLKKKLENIIIPKIDFRNTSVTDALRILKEKSKEFDTTEPDPAKRGVQIESRLETAAVPEAATADGPVPSSNPLADSTVTLSLSNVPLKDALTYVTKLSNLKYMTNDGKVTAVPQSEATDVLATKEFIIPPGFISPSPSEAGDSGALAGTQPGGAALTDATRGGRAIGTREKAKDFLAKAGITFPPGASAEYFPESGKLVVRNTQENLDLMDMLVECSLAAPTKEQSLKEVTQSETAVKDQPFSTFSLHVSDVSFRLAQAALAKGQMPDPESIRPEEFYNAFDYGDPAPAVGEKVGCRIEQSAHPFLQQRNLVRIAMRVPASGRGKGQPLRLTVLLDTSGSMEREDRSESVHRAMEVLASLLGPDDRVTLIGFSRQPRLLLDQIPGDQAAKLVDAVTHTPSEGGTNFEEALKAAGEQALKNHFKTAQNRIVLLTDGAVNLGNARPESLAVMVEKLRQKGVAFDACGVGAEGYNDETLEALTRKGDGRYYFLNRPEDADAGFARQLAGAFRPAAQNVKVQVRFNPARVAHYRLIGFEQHRLNKEDFRNDKVDAAELAAEEAAIALYQVEVLPEGEGELGEVSVRFRDATSTEMVERSWTAPFDAQARAFDKASPSMQLAGTAALLAEKLHGGAMANLIDLDALTPVVNGLRAQYAPQANVQALVTMFGQMQRMNNQVK